MPGAVKAGGRAAHRAREDSVPAIVPARIGAVLARMVP
jgi:hypothetical protein